MAYMKTPREYQLEQETQRLAKESKVVKQHLALEKRLERLEDLVARVCDVLVRTSLVPR